MSETNADYLRYTADTFNCVCSAKHVRRRTTDPNCPHHRLLDVANEIESRIPDMGKVREALYAKAIDGASGWSKWPSNESYKTGFESGVDEALKALAALDRLSQAPAHDAGDEYNRIMKRLDEAFLELGESHEMTSGQVEYVWDRVHDAIVWLRANPIPASSQGQGDKWNAAFDLVRNKGAAQEASRLMACNDPETRRIAIALEQWEREIISKARPQPDEGLREALSIKELDALNDAIGVLKKYRCDPEADTTWMLEQLYNRMLVDRADLAHPSPDGDKA